MGWLQPDRRQEGVHGRGADHARRPGPVQHRDRLVQTLRNLVSRQLTSQRTTQEGLAPEPGLVRIVRLLLVVAIPLNFVAFILLPSAEKSDFYLNWKELRGEKTERPNRAKKISQKRDEEKKICARTKKTVRRVGKFQFRRHATSQDEETVVDSFYLLWLKRQLLLLLKLRSSTA